MALGIQVAVGLYFVSFIGGIILIGLPQSLIMLQTTAYHILSSFSFTVIPVFILMGEIAYWGGVGEVLYKAISKLMGWLRGGLAMATALGCAFFALVTGSSIATIATFSKLAIPEMNKYKYEKSLSCGVVAAAGSMAVMIPPSMAMVIYSMFTEVSLGRLMLAGIIPGFLSALIYMVSIYVRVLINPKLGPPEVTKVPFKERVFSLRWILPMVFVVVVMLGGIYAGVFTPTEAGSFGVLAVLIMTIVLKKLNMKSVKNSLLGTVKTSGMLLLLIPGALLLGKILTISGLPIMIGNWLTSLQVPCMVIVAILMASYLVYGMFIGGVEMIVITMPIYFPIVTALGFDGVWFGILCIKMMEVSMITPPVGINIFVLHGILGKDAPIGYAYKSIFPFLLMDILTLVILMAFPQIVLWLPSQAFG
jgi:tripartite ATP-independent transporter DctM subunit